MIDPEGEEWLTLTEAVKVTGVPLGTLSVWVLHDEVRSHRVDRRRWVCVGDVYERRHAARRSRLRTPAPHS